MTSATRAADFFERYYIWRDTSGSLNKGFNMSVQLSRLVDDTLLSHALRATVLSQPQLLLHLMRDANDAETSSYSADASQNGTNYTVGLVPRLAFEDVVHHTLSALDEPELARLAEVRTACDAPTPSWYIQVSTTGDAQYITFACNHIFFDGKSVVNFFDDLVGALANLSDGNQPLEFVPILYDLATDTVSVPPSSSEVVDLYEPPWWFVAKTALSRFLPSAVQRAFTSDKLQSGPTGSKPIFNLHPHSPSNPSCFRKIHLNPEQLTALLTQCRAAGATLAPYLAAAACRALDESIVQAIGGSFTYVTQLMVCGRRFYPALTNKTRYGLYVAVANDYVTSGQPVKVSAASISRNLVALLGDRSRFWLIGMLRYVNIWNYSQAKFKNKEVRDTIEVSNIGLVRIEHGEWKVDDFVFSQGVTTSHLTLSVASTPKGGLNITIASLETLENIELKGTSAMESFYTELSKTLKSGA